MSHFNQLRNPSKKENEFSDKLQLYAKEIIDRVQSDVDEIIKYDIQSGNFSKVLAEFKDTICSGITEMGNDVWWNKFRPVEEANKLRAE
jgi:hypothetical protein